MILREDEISSVSKRAREITPFIAMDVMEAAQEMERSGETDHPSRSGRAGFRYPAMY